MNVDDATTPTRPPLLLTVGRVNLDLYVEQLGVAMADTATFRASVGGSPTNIAIVARRLGVPAAVLSAAGTDPAGDVVLSQLGATGVDTRWIGRLPAGSTSMAILATLSADQVERQFYRHDPTDAHVGPQAVPGLPWDSLRLVATPWPEPSWPPGSRGATGQRPSTSRCAWPAGRSSSPTAPPASPRRLNSGSRLWAPHRCTR